MRLYMELFLAIPGGPFFCCGRDKVHILVTGDTPRDKVHIRVTKGTSPMQVPDCDPLAHLL